MTTTTGNELGEIAKHSTEPRVERESNPQQQRLETLSQRFPPELIDHIVDHLHDDKKSLIQCSRTSRLFAHATSYHLFRTVRIATVRHCVDFRELVWSSLHPHSSNSTPLSSPSPSTSLPLPAPEATRHRTVPSNLRHTHLHSHFEHGNTLSHTRHTATPPYDVSVTGWDLSKFVRKIEFYSLDPLSPIEEYVSEAIKLVKILPRIREVTFGVWMQSAGMEQIGRAFAAVPVNDSHHSYPTNPPLSVASTTTAISETRTSQSSGSDPLKVHLELVDFESVRTFADFLGSFGGRLRELSLSNVAFGGDGGTGKGGIDDACCLPGIECVYLGYDVVVRQKAFGLNGPTMGTMMNMDLLFGMSAIDKPHDTCDILERIAPNVSELHLFRDDVGDVCMSMDIGPKTSRTLRLPQFRKLKSVTMCVPGPHWSDLIYEIAAWFARVESCEEIADFTCRDGHASPSSLTVTPLSSLPSNNTATRVDCYEGRKRTRVKFFYPVRKGDVDWQKLERAVLGEGIEGQEGGYDCSRFGNHGGGIERESASGNGNDQVQEMLMRISQVGAHGAGGSCSARSKASSVWVEVGSGMAVEVRRELGRLDRLGLLQVNCK